MNFGRVSIVIIVIAVWSHDWVMEGLRNRDWRDEILILETKTIQRRKSGPVLSNVLVIKWAVHLIQ